MNNKDLDIKQIGDIVPFKVYCDTQLKENGMYSDTLAVLPIQLRSFSSYIKPVKINSVISIIENYDMVYAFMKNIPDFPLNIPLYDNTASIPSECKLEDYSYSENVYKDSDEYGLYELFKLPIEEYNNFVTTYEWEWKRIEPYFSGL